MYQLSKLLLKISATLFFSSSVFAASVSVPIPSFPVEKSNLETTAASTYLAPSDYAKAPSYEVEKQVSDFALKAIQSNSVNLSPSKKTSTTAANNATAAQSLVTAAAAPPQYTFSGCTAFTLGTGLYTSLTAQGQVKCFNTYSASDIKVVAQATSQPAGVNYDLFVYYYNPTTGQQEFKSSSTATGNVNEFAAAKMLAGNYLVYVQATTGSSATQFVVGAVGYSGYDQYEANDAIAYATPVNGNKSMVGNTDNAGDYDYFAYTTETDQSKLAVNLISANHSIQVLNGSTWMAANGLTFNVSTNTTYYFRVFNIAATNNVSVTYNLVLSYPVESLANAQVTNNENLTNIGWGLEVFSKITFTGTAVDSKQRIVPYGAVNLSFNSVIGTTTYTYKSGANGAVNYTMTFTPCTGGGYYGSGINSSSPPSFLYTGMAAAVGVYQYCSP